MYRILFALFALMASITLFGQEKIYFDKDWRETSEQNAEFYRIATKEGNLFLVRDFYKSGKMQFEGRSASKTDPLILHGKAVWYYENGAISQITNHINGLPQDSSIQYYSNGKIMTLAIYRSGKIEGPHIGYYPDGSIARKDDYVNGKLSGISIKYNSPGMIDYKLHYKDGILNGPYEDYNRGNQLFFKGSTKDGFRDGTCYDYYYDGGLRLTYTIKDKRLEGTYVGYVSGNDTATYGVFKNGAPVYFRSRSLGTINGSIFSNEMNLVDGVETWKTYRDGKLVLESFYKDGFYYGQWKVYNIDGSRLYKTLDFNGNTVCKEDYLQPVLEEEFRLFMKMSDRFGFDTRLPDEEGYCNGIPVTGIDLPYEEQPYAIKQTDTEDDKPEKKDHKVLKNYIDPSSTTAFKQKNNCVAHDNYKNVTVCTKEVNKILYKVFLSTDGEALQNLKNSAKPKDLDIYFYYQQLENRDYDFNKEPWPDKYVGLSFSESTKEAFQMKLLDYSSVLAVFEHDFWDVDNFSSGQVYTAFEEEIGK